MSQHANQKFQILDKICISLTPKIKTSLLNSLFATNYKFTLCKYCDILNRVVKKNVSIPAVAELTESDIKDYLIHNIKTVYHPEIAKQCKMIADIPLVEQKTPEWFRLREGMISASDAGYFLKKCGNSKAMDTLKIKIGLKSYPTSNVPALLHGNTYEDVARAIYESRNNVVVAEYGIIQSKTPFIGASPDGIIIECKDSGLECQSRMGRLLEIKNPYSREIDDDIKPEYMVQILQQQYTTGLPVCDFVETRIIDRNSKNYNSAYKPYEKLEDMLNDKLDLSRPDMLKRIKNKNIPPENCTKFGMEKGLICWFQKTFGENDVRNKYIHYPLMNKYDTRSIEKWIVDTNSEQFKDGYSFKEVKYWRLEIYSEKTVVYDQNLYENVYIPELEKVWNIICEARRILTASKDKNKNTIAIEKYIEKLENDVNSPFYNETKNKKRLKTSATATNTKKPTANAPSSGTETEECEFNMDIDEPAYNNNSDSDANSGNEEIDF